MAESNETAERDDGSWINNEFIQEILDQIHPSQEATIVGIDKSLAVGKGDNYLSIIYRVDVTYNIGDAKDIHKYHLIVKGFPDGEFVRKFIVDGGLFDRELTIYHTALPAIVNFVSEKVSHIQPLTARAFPTSRPNTVVLEDLKYDGFRMASRKKMLDLQHCRLVIRNLARLHGMSAAFHKHNPEIIGNLGERIFSEANRSNIESFLPLQINTLIKTISSWSGFETYVAKLPAMTNTLLDKLTEECELQADGFNVLCHGDCWSNNYLFKYSSTGEPVDMRFVDFQLSCFGSPARDLSYFMHSSPQRTVRETHFDELLMEYHSELTKTLTSLGCSVDEFSFEDLKNEMRRMAHFAFQSSCSIIPIAVAEVSDVPDMAELTEEDLLKEDPWQLLQKNARFKEEFQQLLPHFENLGVFD